MSEAQARTWQPVCPLAEVPEGGTVRVELDGLPLCLVRAQGRVYAIHDVCSHADVPLSEGEVEGTTVECWLHGSRFDLATGKPVGLPATERVPVYATEVRGETVYVELAGSAGSEMAGSAGDGRVES